MKLTKKSRDNLDCNFECYNRPNGKTVHIDVDDKLLGINPGREKAIDPNVVDEFELDNNGEMKTDNRN